MFVKHLQEYLDKFTDGKKGNAVSNATIYMQVGNYLEEIKRIEVQESNIIGQSAIRVVLKPERSRLMPDVLGYTEKFWYFTVEFKVTKSNKLRFSPLQISYHIAHPHNSFIIAQHLGSGTVKLYEGSVIQELDACGLTLEPLCLGLDACGLYLSKLGA